MLTINYFNLVHFHADDTLISSMQCPLTRHSVTICPLKRTLGQREDILLVLKPIRSSKEEKPKKSQIGHIV